VVAKKLSLLDQPQKCSTLDPRDMRSLIESFPKQFSAAADMALSIRIPSPKSARSLVVAGLGGSAIGGDVVRSVLGKSLRLPLFVSRDYKLPAFVDAGSVVFACSYSGNTEETLSAYDEALQAHAAIICITSGGRLAERAKTDSKPLISIPGGMPPRAALGYSALALLGSIQALGLIPDVRSDLEEAAALIENLAQRYRLEVPLEQNPAKKIASRLFGKIAAIYGGSGLLACAAARWRGQIEENAKNLALHHVLPEMNHNEILGWEFPAAALRQLGVVLLQDKGDHPQVRRRFDLTKQILAQAAGDVQEVWSEGHSPLARAFSVIYLGDFVSLYLAFLNGVDPTRIDAIDYLKRELSS
jgi:glucose/mannose-6-phosphate isomerase